MINGISDQIEVILEKNYPSHARRKIDIPDISLFAVFQESVRQFGDRIAVSFENYNLTYTKLNEEVRRVSSGLSEMGFKKKDRLAVIMPNMPQYIILLLAATKLGVEVVDINPLYTFDEIRGIIEKTKSKVMFVYTDFLTKMVNLFPIHIEKLVVVRHWDDVRSPFNSFPVLKGLMGKDYLPKDSNIRFFNDLGINLKPVADVPINPKEDVAFVQFTGGTTGKAKGVLVSHYNIVSQLYVMENWARNLDKTDVEFISAVPFYHVFGITICIFLPLFIGAKINVIMNPGDMDGIKRFIEKGKNVVFPVIPLIIHGLCDSSAGRKVNHPGNLIVISGAAPLSNKIVNNFRNVFGVEIIEAYGLTEASPTVSMNPLVPGMNKSGSIGLPLPNTQIRIVDTKKGMVEVPLGERGEIIVKGPQVVEKYLDEVAKNITIKNGWLYTGDIGKFDKDGYLYLLDRKKDMIIVSGYSVYSSEVEDIIRTNPAVSECAIIGAPDDETGEAVMAFILLKQGKTLTELEIKEFCMKRMAPYKVPTRVNFADYLPRNALGKVMKKDLRELVK